MAYDGNDERAMERCLLVRDAHMKLVDSMRNEGKHLYAAALLKDDRLCAYCRLSYKRSP